MMKIISLSHLFKRMNLHFIGHQLIFASLPLNNLKLTCVSIIPSAYFTNKTVANYFLSDLSLCHFFQLLSVQCVGTQCFDLIRL